MCAALAIVVSPGCGGSSKRSGPQAQDDVAGAIGRAAAGSSVFTFAYAAEPEQGGRLLHAWAFDTITDPCLRLFTPGGAGDKDVTFFLLSVQLSSTEHADYRILPNPRFPSTERVAEVFYETVSLGEGSPKVFAAAGTATYVEGPVTESEWGASAHIRVAAQFPATGTTTVGCSSVAAIDATSATSCQCRRGDGTEFSCVPASPTEDCCIGSDPGRTLVDVEIRPTPCAAACAYTSPELGHYCTELQTSG
jgi:hypothetical protein